MVSTLFTHSLCPTLYVYSPMLYLYGVLSYVVYSILSLSLSGLSGDRYTISSMYTVGGIDYPLRPISSFSPYMGAQTI